MTTEIDAALSIAIKNLISQLTRNAQLGWFAGNLQRRRQYDIYEKEYIQNQRLRNELGNEYQSSDSEQQKQNNNNTFSKLSRYQLKRMMRKTLVEKKFDQNVLAPIPIPKEQEPQNDQLTTVRLISDQPISTHELRTPTELNIIDEAKEIVEEEPEKNSCFGLEFIIKELEKIEQMNAYQNA